MGRPTKDGESPVYENLVKLSGILSTARHEKSCRKQAGPSVKAKYNQVTDSEPVPWGKGEKNRGSGVKRTWNRMLTRSQSPLKGDGVPFVEWTGELPYRARLSRRYGAEAKASLKRARVRCGRPETRWSSHDQVEVKVILDGGPNRPPLKSWRMNCG